MSYIYIYVISSLRVNISYMRHTHRW